MQMVSLRKRRSIHAARRSSPRPSPSPRSAKRRRCKKGSFLTKVQGFPAKTSNTTPHRSSMKCAGWMRRTSSGLPPTGQTWRATAWPCAPCTTKYLTLVHSRWSPPTCPSSSARTCNWATPPARSCCRTTRPASSGRRARGTRQTGRI